MKCPKCGTQMKFEKEVRHWHEDVVDKNYRCPKCGYIDYERVWKRLEY